MTKNFKFKKGDHIKYNGLRGIIVEGRFSIFSKDNEYVCSMGYYWPNGKYEDHFSEEYIELDVQYYRMKKLKSIGIQDD